MKPVEKLAIALRECERCGNLVVLRYGVPDEHSSKGQPCKSGQSAAKSFQLKNATLG